MHCPLIVLRRLLQQAGAATAAWFLTLPAQAEPYRPAADHDILASVPARRGDARSRELLDLRQAWQRQPQDLAAALRWARRAFAEVGIEGDPRYVSYAQAALQPWWLQAAPPTPVRLLRAQIVQFNHHFSEAMTDLDAVVAAEPDNVDAWAWRTAVLMVMARYDDARQSCERLARLVAPLQGAACRAQVDAVTGRADAAAAALTAALRADAAAAEPSPAALRLWCLTRLGEIEERRGAWAAAEAAFKAGLALGLQDVYLQAAYADFLLDQRRPDEVVRLLRGSDAAGPLKSDVLLLRLAVAARQAGHPQAKTWASEMAARFDAARQRGDETHRKEEARFYFQVMGDAARALPLAVANFADQREPNDARVLLELALAQRQKAAAAPALAWVRASGFRSAAIDPLVRQLEALP